MSSEAWTFKFQLINDFQTLPWSTVPAVLKNPFNLPISFPSPVSLYVYICALFLFQPVIFPAFTSYFARGDSISSILLHVFPHPPDFVFVIEYLFILIGFNTLRTLWWSLVTFGFVSSLFIYKSMMIHQSYCIGFTRDWWVGQNWRISVLWRRMAVTEFLEIRNIMVVAYDIDQQHGMGCLQSLDTEEVVEVETAHSDWLFGVLRQSVYQFSAWPTQLRRWRLCPDRE